MVEGDRRLWSNVLLQAVRDVLGVGVGKKYCRHVDIAGARVWIASDIDEFGSFVWVCNSLGYRPDYIRRKVGGLTSGVRWVRPST